MSGTTSDDQQGFGAAAYGACPGEPLPNCPSDTCEAPGYGTTAYGACGDSNSRPEPPSCCPEEGAAEAVLSQMQATPEKSGKRVAALQKILLNLGFAIDQEEIDSSSFGASTSAALLAFQSQRGLLTSGSVDSGTAAELQNTQRSCKEYYEAEYGREGTVHGRILRADYSPLAYAQVQVFVVELRDETLLGSAQSDRFGCYTFSYRVAGGRALALRVAANTPGLTDTGSSAVFYDVPKDLRIDVVVGQALQVSEFERLVQIVTALLPAGVTIADLREDDDHQDLKHLAAATGIELDRWQQLVRAHRYSAILASATGTPGDLPITIEPPPFYGLFRQGMPTSMERLVSTARASLSQALTQAGQNNTIQSLTEPEANEVLDRLANLATFIASDPATGSYGPGNLLADVELSDKSVAFVDAWRSYSGSLQQFWDDEPGGLTSTEAAALQKQIQIAAIVGMYEPMVTAVATSLDSKSITELATFKKDDWLALIGNDGLPEGLDDADDYADRIMAIVEDAMPTRVHAARIVDSALGFNDKSDLQTFFNAHFDAGEEIDLGTFDIATYFANPANPGLPSIPERFGKLRINLERRQRLFKLTTRNDDLEVLEGLQLGSAQAIVAQGKPAFLALVSAYSTGPTITAAKANQIFNAAAQTASATLHVLTSYAQQSSPIDLNVLSSLSTQLSTAPSGSEAFENVRALLGATDFCACSECRSIHGPAAYLTDILAFLGRVPVIGESNQTALDVLKARRPDLTKLLLSCDNTNIVVPQIDLAIELLEAKVAGDSAFSKIPVETTGSEAERAALPQSLDGVAYTNLRDMVGWGLPFDLQVEEARGLLAHLGIARADLMRVLQSSDGNPDKKDIGAEALGISSSERVLITMVDGGNTPWKYWGFYDGDPKLDITDWTKPIRENVSFALERSGLMLEELQELLRCSFIDPNHNTDIDLDGTLTCDLSKAQIQGGFDAPMALRLRCFVTLQEKLGWTARELDQAVTICGIAAPAPLTPGFLKQLADIEALRGRLQLSVMEVLAFFGKIETPRDDQDQGALYDRLFCNPLVVVDPGFKLNDGEPDASEDPLLVHAAALAAALRLAPADLLLLIQGDPSVGIPHVVEPEYPSEGEEGEGEGEGGEEGEGEGGEEGEGGDDAEPNLTLTNLSALYRYALLSRALRLPVRDVLGLKALSNIDPFGSTDTAVDFCKLVQELAAAKTSVAELELLLAQVTRPGLSGVPDEKSATQLAASLQKQLAQIAQAAGALPVDVLPDPIKPTDAIALRAALEPLLSGDEVAQTLALLDTLPTADELVAVIPELSDTAETVARPESPVGLRRVVAHFEAGWQGGKLTVHGLTDEGTEIDEDLTPSGSGEQWVFGTQTFQSILTVSKAQQSTDTSVAAHVGFVRTTVVSVPALLAAGDTFIDNVLPKLLVVVDEAAKSAARNALLQRTDAPTGEPLPGLEHPVERYGYLLALAQRRLAHDQCVSALIATVGTALQIEARIAETLLYAVHAPDSTDPALSIFLSSDFIKASEPSARAVSTTLRLAKAAFLLRRLGLTGTDFDIWCGDDPADPHFNTNFGWIDLDLPVVANSWSEAISRFGKWRRMAAFFALRASLPRRSENLLRALQASDISDPVAALTDYAAAIDRATGWGQAFVLSLCNDVLNIGSEDFSKSEWVVRIAAAVTLLKRLGCTPAAAMTWRPFELAEGATESLRQAVKAHYDEDEWASVAPGLRDPLRVRQRDALLAGIRATTGKTTSDLLGKLLLDPEVAPCAKTSRLKQALSSVQLFVQRITLNMESGVALSEAASAEWKWMKNFRVWEANRKIFLYPENWAEPELRDDKTPFFETLESELLQEDLTDEVAEDAFVHYLESLSEVSRLDVCGFCYEDLVDEVTQAPSGRLLHVIARTQAAPHVYYYRRRVNEDYWTAWEKIDLDIEGDYLAPYVWNRRLYLFWLVMIERGKEVASVDEDDEGKQPAKQTDVRLAWSTYSRGKWSAKKMTKDAVSLSYNPKYTKYRTYVLRVYEEADGLNGGEAPSLVVQCSNLNNLYGQLYDRDAPLPTQIARFVFKGCTSQPRPSSFSSDSYYLLPPLGLFNQTNRFFNRYSYPLRLYAGHYSATDWESLSEELQPVGVLGKAPGTYEIIYPHQEEEFVEQPFFFQDERRTYFVETHSVPAGRQRSKASQPKDWNLTLASPGLIAQTVKSYYSDLLFVTPLVNFDPPGDSDPTDVNQLNPVDGNSFVKVSNPPLLNFYKPTYFTSYQFLDFYHPYVCKFVESLNARGVPGLLRLESQQRSRNFFEGVYDPNPDTVDKPYPLEDVDFSYDGAYSQYNWELFFHVPMRIAGLLSQQQRFEEAQKWYHYIFDPTIGFSSVNQPSSAVPWRFQPLLDEATGKRIDELLALLDETPGDPDQAKARVEMEKQVRAMRQNPFKPHIIARLRTSAYARQVVMKYLDNLIAWADQLFRQDTIESINEAVQLYFLAADILGQRPRSVSRPDPESQSFDQLKTHLDDFSNALVSLENALPAVSAGANTPGNDDAPSALSSVFYFCIPPNDKLLGYWDTIADRLFKIRNCMNIEGLVRQLPLFEPPIDPALLVAATAAGVDLRTALNDAEAPLSPYRFATWIQKANELLSEVKALGGALLSALEKKDAEELAQLRTRQEQAVLQLALDTRTLQVDEANEALAAAGHSVEAVQTRLDYYRSRELMNDSEKKAYDLMKQSMQQRNIANSVNLIAALFRIIPNFTIGLSGVFGSPVSTTAIGGELLANAASLTGLAASQTAESMSGQAQISSTYGGYQRRMDDWAFQGDLAEKDLAAAERQQAAAAIRLNVAQNELRAQQLQIDNNQELDRYYKDKFTNEALYTWMAGQLSTVYFTVYQLAYDLAKRAEKSYQFERGEFDAKFVQFGYWDNLKQGLLAGEKLQADLRRMEAAYLANNKREYEVTRSVSLLLHAPDALLALRESGSCIVDLNEALFDRDYPGQYFRRVKSVAVSVPCVVGPYANVNCKLTLQRSTVRIDPSVSNYTNSDHFRDNLTAIESIVTSTAQNDAGLFEPNLRDERYLPFEGAGAISTWQIELPRDTNDIDRESIADVILHIRYTAREGGSALAQAARGALPATPRYPVRLLSLRHERPEAWHDFLYPTGSSPSNTFTMPLDRRLIPNGDFSRQAQVTDCIVLLKFKEEWDSSLGESPWDRYRNGTAWLKTGGKDLLPVSGRYGGLAAAQLDVASASPPSNTIPGGSLTFSITPGDLSDSDLLDDGLLKPEYVEDVGLLLTWEWV